MASSLAYATWQQNRERISQLLGLSALNQARILSAHFEFYEAILFEVRDRFTIKPEPTRSEFKDLADTIFERAPEVEAIAWIPVVPETRRQGFEEAAQRDNILGFSFKMRGPNGEFVPSRATEQHLPIYFIEPAAQNHGVVGYDLATDALAETIARCKDGPRTILSPLVELVQRPGRAVGLATVKPVYDVLVEDASYQPSHSPKGYVATFYYLPIFAPRLMQMIPDTGLDVLIVDDRATTNRLIAYRAAGQTNVVVGGDNYPLDRFDASDTVRFPLTPGKSQWSLYVHASPEWIAERTSRKPWMPAVGGTVVTSLVLSLLISAARRTEQVKADIDLRTSELRETNAELQNQMQAYKRSEAALRDAQSILLAAQRLGATGSWEVDLVNGRLTWSEQVYRIFDRDPATFTPTNAAFFEAVHEDDREAVRQAARNAIERGQPYHIEHRIRLPRNPKEIRHLQEHAEIVPDAAGRPVRMIGAVRDLTAHRLAEAELETERALLRTIIDAIPDSIYVKDSKGVYILQNRANLDRHGLKKASDGVGKTVFDLTPRDIAEQYNRDDQEVLATGKALVNREEPFITRQGEKGVFLTTKIAFNGPDGKIAGLVGISRDVTKLLRMAEERQQFERHLNDAARLESLGVLAGGIAHDFNNLLTGVLGNASLLRITLPPTHESLETIGGIEAAAEKAAELCRQMLAYAGKGRFVLREFELNQLIQQTSVLLKHSVSKKADIVFHLAPEPIMVEGDETQLGQILMNLVINASEALEENPGTITLRSGNEFATREYLSEPYLPPDLAEGHYAFVEVIDTGKGMTEDLRAHIFEPFFTTKFAGRGLGLAAALGIVRAHHGALKVASTPGKGTAFRLLLPLKNRRPAAIPPPPPPEPVPTSPVAARVLVIDDEAAVRSVTRKMLSLLRCSVVEASDGEEGLAKFLAEPHVFQIVLLDLTMPRLNGYQVSAEIWKNNPALPIVFMSGYNEEETPSSGVGNGTVPAFQGPRGFLQKPFTLKALAAKLEAFLVRPALPPR